MANKNNNYTVDSIQTLDYPENIQKRPSMYIGRVDIEGNTHLVREVIDNSVDEALNGFGNKITITISNKKGFCSVEDEGRGIPAQAIEKAFCTIHASGKFDNEDYSTSAGTNGVGCTAVNALSKKFYVECTNNGIRYSQEFSNGLPVTKLKKLGSTKKKGTYVEFYPNPKFMESTEFDIQTIINEMKDKVYALPNVEIIINNLDGEKYTFKKGSLNEFVKDNSKDKLLEPLSFGSDVEFVDKINNKKKKFNYELSFTYDKKKPLTLRSFCNSLVMREGGIQETSLKTAFAQFFKQYINDNKLIPKNYGNLEITTEHCVDGLICIMSIKHPSPIFENQTKNKLTNKEVANIKKTIVEKLNEYAINNKTAIKNICNKIIINAKADEAAKKAREVTAKKGENKFSIVSDLSKLANCISTDTSENEIFITEGRSASGTAKEARDKRTQAVYSLRGKMLNTIGMETLKVLANKECADLAFILTGIKNAIDNNFKIEYLKYGKVIMLCDADVDGYHISMLGLTYIFEHMRDIITEGHMYVAIPPLYSILEKGKKRYFVDQFEYDQYIYKKILKSYKFVDENEKDISNIKKITDIFNKYDELSKYIEEISNNNIGLSKEFLLDLFNYILENEYTKENIIKFIKSCNDIILNNKQYEGFYNDNYLYFTINNLIKIFNNINKYIKENNIPILNIYYNNDFSDEYYLFTIKEYDEIIKSVTPKSRVRLKGLGEMDADELKETTLDVEKRNIYKVTIPDIKAAEESMNNYMNGNSKYVDFRKNILLTKQEN